MGTNLQKILDLLDEQGIEQVTFEAGQFNEEYALSSDDKDYVTFSKSPSSYFICDRLLVCDYETTTEPIYKGWFMTINYHG